MGEVRSACTGKRIGNIPLGRPRYTREDSIRKDIKEIGLSTRNWINSTLRTEIIKRHY